MAESILNIILQARDLAGAPIRAVTESLGGLEGAAGRAGGGVDRLGTSAEHAGGAYKPAPRGYALATKRFACEPDAIVFVSSNGWDAWGATQFGFRVAWCNRAGMPHETLPNPPALTINGLGLLGKLLT